ncbi:MAG: LacI family DNA-binding transcriptional regulator [Anaerolineales bacterium]|nr:LacI family DNA-binding transcriptional regulator [Anaerolineales bacterium]
MTSKRITSKDVAIHAGVSRTTVSLVLNNVPGVQIPSKTRLRVRQAAKELGYVPEAAARALASRRSLIIGLVLTRNPHHIASDAFLTQILDVLTDKVRKHGMRLLLDIIEETHHPEIYMELARARRIDGIILSGPTFSDQGLQLLENERFPTVLMGELPGSSFYSIDIDNYAAAKMAVEHLIELGHTQIGMITNAPLAYTASTERLRGFRAAIEQAGLTYQENLIRFGDFDPQSGYQQMNQLMDESPIPSAVFAASDVIAIGAMGAVRERGLRIPTDIALLGFDDIPFARYVDPPLSTVNLPATDLASKALEVLFQLIAHKPPKTKHIRLDTKLVVRHSCGALVCAQTLKGDSIKS